ncbi:hypothetical protein WICMUC_000118 [Wickerhamomyces mucosus]|uniref:Carboxypeptidase n=1 Tax=Wickerhamomyces mucosus TaxID=1378264 RepID=A0A9P8PZ04_9ASCO|nr:hypothetical protein WICMUC_000118 [Wickerhamomyces mucosus]
MPKIINAFFALSLITGRLLAFPVEILSKYYIVDNLPGSENIAETDLPDMHAGHINIGGSTENNLFFWKFAKQESDTNRTIIWLNGGPGCSSMDGALMEVGPFRVNSDLKLELNPGSYHQAADIIFVDQPSGTGFSTNDGNYDKDLYNVTDDFVKFLVNYYRIFPEDASNELYIAGESYAGQYIPYIAKGILNSDELQQNLKINLKGLLIGNGWIDPTSQSLSYIPFLLEKEVLHTSDPFFSKLLDDQEKCQNALNSDKYNDAFSIAFCENILTKILLYTRDKDASKNLQCINMYDFRLRDSYPSCGMNWPPDLDYVNPYLGQDEVVKSLNLNVSTVSKWRECDDKVSRFLKNDGTKPSINLLPELLEKLEVILFGGNNDIICNNKGVTDMIGKMRWGGTKGFDADSIKYDWHFNGTSVGNVQSSKNLTFVEIYDSSHMVPFDKPLEARGIFDLLIGNYAYIDNTNSTYLETPIYKSGLAENSEKNGDTPNDDDSAANTTTKSSLPFIIYIVAVFVAGGIAYFYNKTSYYQENTSILRNNNNNKNRNPKRNHRKTVSWADDDQRYGSKQGNESEDKDIISNLNQSGKLGGFFHGLIDDAKGKYQATSSHIDDEEIDLSASASDNFYENIELQSNPGNQIIHNESNDNYNDFNFDIEGEISSSGDKEQRF